MGGKEKTENEEREEQVESKEGREGSKLRVGDKRETNTGIKPDCEEIM